METRGKTEKPGQTGKTGKTGTDGTFPDFHDSTRRRRNPGRNPGDGTRDNDLFLELG